MSKLPKIALFAAMAAFLAALLDLLASLQLPLLIPLAAVPIAAGIGILLGRVWSAYGFALVQLSGLLLLPWLVLWSTIPLTPQLGVLAGMNAAVAALFFLAGRALQRSGYTKGFLFPWIAVAVLQTAPFLFIRAFVNPSGSMEDTLLVGDQFLAIVFPKVHASNGDVVIFHFPIDHKQIFTKRVIGSPGDHIRMVARQVYRNGSKLTEPYAVAKFAEADPFRDNFPGHPSEARVYDPAASTALEEMLAKHVSNGELIVPAGKYFVLGDNRDNSLDSRYWGLLDESEIIGEPVLIYNSVAAADDRQKAVLPKIRWNRVMKLVR